MNPRPLDPGEEQLALVMFPNMDFTNVWATGQPDPRYNCIARSLGIDTYIAWPAGDVKKIGLLCFLCQLGL